MAVKQGKAGDYWERVTRLVRATTTQSNQHKLATYTDGNTYWAYTNDVKADKKLAYAINNTVVEVEVHIRGYPTIDPLDRLRVETTGYVLEIKGIKLDYDEGATVVVGKYIPSLQ